MRTASKEQLVAAGLRPGSKEASDYLKYLEDSSKTLEHMDEILKNRPELRLP